MRISAKLDDSLAGKVKHLMRASKEKISDIVKASLEQCHENCMRQTNSALILEKTGFIGCAEGPENFSENCKRYPSEDLDGKFDHRRHRVPVGFGQQQRSASLACQNRTERIATGFDNDMARHDGNVLSSAQDRPVQSVFPGPANFNAKSHGR